MSKKCLNISVLHMMTWSLEIGRCRSGRQCSSRRSYYPSLNSGTSTPEVSLHSSSFFWEKLDFCWFCCCFCFKIVTLNRISFLSIHILFFRNITNIYWAPAMHLALGKTEKWRTELYLQGALIVDGSARRMLLFYSTMKIWCCNSKRKQFHSSGECRWGQTGNRTLRKLPLLQSQDSRAIECSCSILFWNDFTVCFKTCHVYFIRNATHI